jgi:hypothetical protein
MKVYAVRPIDRDEDDPCIGLFAVRSLRDLPQLIDEELDPCACEYAPMTGNCAVWSDGDRSESMGWIDDRKWKPVADIYEHYFARPLSDAAE